jgi:ABC-type polysaccharide/polyol phosphate export permease
MYYFKNFYTFIITLFQQKYIIGQLVKRDFQNKYLGSYLGLPWAFVQPGVMILIIWFAFTYGLKVGKMESGMPFTPWFICGMIPWLYISETLTSSANSLIEYSYLIKKTSFKVAVIPFIKIFTTLIIHFFFILVIAIFAVSYGYYPTIHWIQIVYLIFAAFILLTGIGWLTSSITVFVRDMGPVVNVVVSILFWVTPIMWPYAMLTGHLRYLALLNPFFYITEGYRYTFLEKTWIFQNMQMTVFFWCVTAFIFVTGALVFKKLTPHFADVL